MRINIPKGSWAFDGYYGQSSKPKEPATLGQLAPELLDMCKVLLESARAIRGEAVTTGKIQDGTLASAFAADELAQALIEKASSLTN